MHDGDPKVAARDAIEGRDWFEFPLLRIDGTFQRRVRRNSLVGLLVDAWADYQGFIDGQQAVQPFLVPKIFTCRTASPDGWLWTTVATP